MDMSEEEIINTAITIFQNVGIKRWIDKIQVLMEEQIYFQICKIIFPDSQNMIQIFKISQSGLPTGQKIQKIIQMIARIIRLDLYHISGEQIAQGNLNHLVNWLQLLEALSKNCVQHVIGEKIQTQPHDAEAIMYSNEDYYTVIGMQGQFSKHGYSREGQDQDNPSQTTTQNHLPPIGPVESNEDREKKKKKTKKKQVKFAQSALKQIGTKNQSIRTTTTQPTIRHTNTYFYPKKLNLPKQVKFLNKKKTYINKMYTIAEEIQKKQINDQNYEFEMWAQIQNRNALHQNKIIEQEDKQRKSYIKEHIGKRQQIVDSLMGQRQAVKTMKKMFNQQKKAQKKMKRFYRQQYEEEAQELMDLNFASNIYNQLQQFLAAE